MEKSLPTGVPTVVVILPSAKQPKISLAEIPWTLKIQALTFFSGATTTFNSPCEQLKRKLTCCLIFYILNDGNVVKLCLKFTLKSMLDCIVAPFFISNIFNVCAINLGNRVDLHFWQWNFWDFNVLSISLSWGGKQHKTDQKETFNKEVKKKNVWYGLWISYFDCRRLSHLSSAIRKENNPIQFLIQWNKNAGLFF